MTTVETVFSAIRFMEDNLTEGIGVCDVAEAVHYSQFYFSRLFSRHARISVYDYMLRRRISESYKALLMGRERILDLAVRFGFQSGEGYARAFRKVFGENPSEAARDKSFDVYEAIDLDYLRFLDGLEVETCDRPAEPCFFEVEAASGLDAQGDLLVVLSKEHRKGIAAIYRGCVRHQADGALAYRLEGLTHRALFPHPDARHAFRYFTDNLYDAAAMRGNFLLLRRGETRVDFYAPTNEALE